MFDKQKIVIFILAGTILIVSIFFLVAGGSQKRNFQQQIKELEDAKVGLTSQINEKIQESKTFKEKLDFLNKSLERLNAEKEDIQKQYDVAAAGKEALQNEIAGLNTQLAAERSRAPKTAAKTEETTPMREEVSPETSQQEAYWSGILKKKADLEVQVDSLTNQVKELKLGKEQIEQEKSAIEQEITTFKSDSGEIKREIEYNKKLVDNLSRELMREKNDRFQILESYKTLKSENKSLKQQLKSVDGRKVDLERKFAELQTKNSELENSLNKMESFIREKILQMDNLKEELGMTAQEPQAQEKKKGAIQLQPIVVRSQEAKSKTPESPDKKGNILAVNTEENFVVINLGETSGVKVGDTFKVYSNDDELVADIEAIKVRQSVTACDIKNENTPILVGYKIK